MTAALKLYEYTDELDVIRDWIDEHRDEIIAAGGDLDAVPELRDLLDELQGEIKEKIERVALFIREQSATAAAIKAERQRLERLEKSAEKAAEGMKHYLQMHMERAGFERVDGTLIKVRLQKSPPSVQHTLAGDAIRAAFEQGAEWVVEIPATYRIDSKLLIEYHRAGRALPEGVTVEQGRHVRFS